MKENVIPLASVVKNKDDFWNSLESDCSLGVDDFTSGNENDAKDSVELCTMPKELFENSTDFYTDKNVTECQLPELVVCYNESTYNVVKDICIDDGVPSEKKILIENVKDDLNGLKSLSQKHYDKEGVDAEFLDQDAFNSPSDEDCNRGAANECGNKEKLDLDLQTIDELKYSSGDDVDLKSSSESDSDLDACSPCGPADQLQPGEENCNAIEKSVDVASRDEFLSNSVPLVDELRPQTSLKPLLESSECRNNDVGQHSCQISCEEAIPEHPVPILAAVESNKSGLADTTNTQDMGPENVNEQPPKLPNGDGISNNLSVTNQVQRDEGESSFCVAGPVSGVITYSGPISYSGSISLRSDSSTTSTRSFAFPVLQNEWNSSPIRMAKAERGYFRRHRRWKQGLLCCRF